MKDDQRKKGGRKKGRKKKGKREDLAVSWAGSSP